MPEADGTRFCERKEAGDLPGLARAAHTLKGSVAIFAAQAAYDAALRIEQMGRDGDASRIRRRVGRSASGKSTGSHPLSTANSQEVVTS